MKIIEKWIICLSAAFVVCGSQAASATHPIQRNWEFRFSRDTHRPFFISAGESGFGQKAKMEGSIFIADDDHGMPILRELNVRLVDVVSVNAGTGEIIEPITDPFIAEGDLLPNVLLNDANQYRLGTLTESVDGIHMVFETSGTASNLVDLAETQLQMDFIGRELHFSGRSTFTSVVDGEFMFIDPESAVFVPEPSGITLAGTWLVLSLWLLVGDRRVFVPILRRGV
jgi:hypothetical protein